MTETGIATASPAADTGAPLLTVEDLRVCFGAAEVVKGISFTTRLGRCLAIVGESGSGKSVTARTLVGLTGPGAHVQAGRIDLAGTDLTRQSERSWRTIRGRQIGFILQDALVSLDQLRRVGDEVAEPLKVHGWGTRESRAGKVLDLLGSVGVPEPETGVTVAVKVSVLPALMVAAEAVRAVLVAGLDGAVTETATALEVEAAKSLLPA